MSYPPYVTGKNSVSIIMLKVLLALVPGIAVYVWVFGSGVLISLALASLTALVSEAAMLRLRKRPVMPFLLDGSALVTAWLLALALPPLAPWWLIVVGTLFAIVIAKAVVWWPWLQPVQPGDGGLCGAADLFSGDHDAMAGAAGTGAGQTGIP